jgi:hypothetical protein
MIPTAEYHTKMLQIQRKMRGWNSKMLQNAVEIAASSSKMLQIARETDRTGNPKKNPKRKKPNSPNISRPFLFNSVRSSRHVAGLVIIVIILFLDS